MENMLSSTTNESCRKVLRTKMKPSLIIEQVEMDEQRWWCFLAACRGRIKALDPKADPDASSAEDDWEDCSDLGSLGKRLFVNKVDACDQCRLSSP